MEPREEPRDDPRENPARAARKLTLRPERFRAASRAWLRGWSRRVRNGEHTLHVERRRPAKLFDGGGDEVRFARVQAGELTVTGVPLEKDAAYRTRRRISRIREAKSEMAPSGTAREGFYRFRS